MGFRDKDVHVDQPLSNVAIAYMPKGMIAHLIAPEVTVQKQSDAYPIWDQGDMFRIENDYRAPGTKANIITRSMSSGTYFAKNYALADLIPNEDIANADPGFIFTQRSSRVEFLKSKLYLSWEYRLACQITSGSNIGSHDTVNSGWTTYTTDKSDPYGDIQTAISNVQDATGYRPNRILFGDYAWRHFRRHDDVIDLCYGNVTNGKAARVVSQEQAAALFEVDKILVGGAYRNSADEGLSMSLSQIWNDNVLVYYAPEKPSKEDPSFMYSFRWNKIMNMDVKVFVRGEEEAEKISLGYYQDEKITAKNLGFLIKGVGSSQ